jgi:hypothetical protein
MSGDEHEVKLIEASLVASDWHDIELAQSFAFINVPAGVQRVDKELITIYLWIVILNENHVPRRLFPH